MPGKGERMRQLFCAGLLSVSLNPVSTATAEVYRCPGPDGVPAFQSVPCPGGSSAPLALEPLNTLGEGVRKSEQAWLRERAAGQHDRTRSTSGSATAAQRRRQEERCLKERQRLDAVQAQLRRGYKPGQGERLRRRREEHAAYLRRFCD